MFSEKTILDTVVVTAGRLFVLVLQVLISYANLTNLTKAAANTAVTVQLSNIIHQDKPTEI